MKPKLNCRPPSVGCQKKWPFLSAQVLELCDGRMTGFEILEQIKKNYPLADVEILESVILNFFYESSRNGVLKLEDQ